MRARHASGKERTYSISELAQEFDITPAPSAITRTRAHHPDPGGADPHLQPQGQDPPETDPARQAPRVQPGGDPRAVRHVRHRPLQPDAASLHDPAHRGQTPLPAPATGGHPDGDGRARCRRAALHPLPRRLENRRGLTDSGVSRPGIPVFQWISAVAGPDPATPCSHIARHGMPDRLGGLGKRRGGANGEIRPWSHNNSPARSECGAPHESFP